MSTYSELWSIYSTTTDYFMLDVVKAGNNIGDCILCSE